MTNPNVTLTRARKGTPKGAPKPQGTQGGKARKAEDRKARRQEAERGEDRREGADPKGGTTKKKQK